MSTQRQAMEDGLAGGAGEVSRNCNSFGFVLALEANAVDWVGIKRQKGAMVVLWRMLYD